MRGLYTCLLLLFGVSAQLCAQEIDTIPISTKDLDLKLKKSPLPSLRTPIIFKAVDLSPVVISSKVNYWKTTTSIGFNVNQSAFSNNWTGGGVNSIAIGGLLNFKAEYVKDTWSYSTELDLQYGKVKNKAQLEQKTSDRIFWDNKVALQLSKKWFFFGSLDFESQFDNGYTYGTDADGHPTETLISKFMSPGYTTESFGFEYKPVKYFSARFSAATLRQTYVLANNELFAADTTKTSNFGVPVGKTFRDDLAAQVVGNFDKDIAKNVNLKFRYALFIPYNDIRFTSHRLDVTLTAKVNRFMNVSITGVGLYDRNSAPKIQGSQALAMGLTFVFPR